MTSSPSGLPRGHRCRGKTFAAWLHRARAARPAPCWHRLSPELRAGTRPQPVIDGTRPLATTFTDYLMPTVRETPKVEVILREDYTSPLNPLGIKGAG